MCLHDKEGQQHPGLHQDVYCQQDVRSDSSALLKPGETLSPLLVSPVQGKLTGVNSVKDNEDDEICDTSVKCKESGPAGVVQPGEQAQGEGLIYVYKNLMERSEEDGARLFLVLQ